MKTARFVLCLMLVVNGIRLLAGDLTVEGDLNVTSNLASRTLSVTNATVETLEVTGSAVFAGPIQGDGAGITNLSGVVYTQALAQAIAGATSSLASAQSLVVALDGLSVVSQSVEAVTSVLATNTVPSSRTITINGDKQTLAGDALFWVPPNPANVNDFTYTTNSVNGIVITGYSGPGGALVIPDTINGLPVTAIGGNVSYYNYSITSVSGGANVESIGDFAFQECWGLTSVSLPSVMTVGACAFQYCGSLTTVFLPSIETVGDAAFFYCSNLTTLAFPSVVTVGDLAFYHCSSLTTLSFPSVVTVANWAFQYCGSLTSVSFFGDAPAVGSDIYSGSDSVINYVLNPTATGWGETFGGRPVMRASLYGDGSHLTGINGTNMAPGSIGAALLAPGAVSAASIASSAVGTGQLADGAVSSAKIQDGTIADADIAAGASIAQSKVTGLAAAVGSLSTHLAASGNPHSVTAAQVGAYTTNQTDAAILAALNLFSPDACVRTNHAGDVSVAGALSVTGSVSAASFVGDGWGVTNLNLSSYVGVFAPSDLSAYADGTTVVYSNGHFQVAGSLASSDVTNTVALAWPNLDTDTANDLTVAGGTLAGNLNMSSNRVMNLPSPQADGDALSKAYLRAVLSALPRQGDLSMGSFTNGAPTEFPLSFDQ